MVLLEVVIVEFSTSTEHQMLDHNIIEEGQGTRSGRYSAHYKIMLLDILVRTEVRKKRVVTEG